MREPSVDVTFVLPQLVEGGAQRVVADVAEGLSTRFGLHVEVLALLDPPAASHRTAGGVDVRALGASRIRRALPALVGELRARPPRAVVTTLKHVSIGLSLLSWRLPRGTRHVARIANTYSRELEVVSGSRARVERTLIRWSHRRIDGFICVSEGVRADLVGAFGVDDARCTTIPNPVDVEQLRARAAAATGPVPPEVVGPGPRFVAIGRLEPQKDHATLLGAFALVQGDLPDASLLIVGDGSLAPDLRRLAGELGLAARVGFTGFVDNPYPLLAGSDVLVLSSRFEGMPNVLLEALALGVPCASTDCPSGPAEILVDPALGLLVPVADPTALAGAMVELARRPPDPTSGPEHVARHHGPERAQQAYRDAILGGPAA